MARLAAVLLSRQALRPTAATPWVSHAAEAVAWIGDRGMTLCTSVGMQTWELLTFLAARGRIVQRIFIPASDSRTFESALQSVRGHFDLDESLVEFRPVFAENAGSSGKALMRLRDQQVLAQADVIVPVSLRPGGNLQTRACAFSGGGGHVVPDFETPYVMRRERLKYRVDDARLSAEIARVGDEYVIHWTRTSHGPWPTERLADYYAAVLAADAYPRGAFDSLRNILASGRLVSSARHMPGRVATVAFSGQPPRAMVPLMRWRARYQEMSFEPYGIGVARAAAAEQGVAMVNYWERSVGAPDIAEGEEWLRQSVGSRTDWRDEHEYRCLGDFELSAIDRSLLVAFCLTPNEAAAIENEFGVRAVPFLAA